MARNDATKVPTADTGHTIEGAFDEAQRGADINLEKMAARVHARLFSGPMDPVRIGRFVILERVGQGGMGVVYEAYDPKLDRRVALKLIRSRMGFVSQAARERMLREARALARLSHPNIVPIHDVGTLDEREYDEQVFIVMGFVAGQPLRAWVSDQRPKWQAIVESYLQAASGLHAAHEVGLIHRDFKPDNVLIDTEGRVQVVDFGLARMGQGDGADSHTADDRSAALVNIPASRPVAQALTATGALIGTPAYMSPEQFAGAPLGPATDQFSFCVSLYESLYGRRPFVGNSDDEYRAAVKSSTVRAPPRGTDVPGWIEPILRRGLAADPAERHESMAELAAALSRDPARTRRRALVALAALVLGALSLYAVLDQRSARAPVCQGAPTALQSVWNSERRADVTRALNATERAYAAIAGPRLLNHIDKYADAWIGSHRQACLAHRRGEQSGALLDQRMSCLERRKVALDAAIAVIEESEATGLDRAMEVISGLPPLGFCADPWALSAEIPPPEDPRSAAEVRQLSDQLARVQALEQAGRYGRALELLTPVKARAESIAYRPLLAELALVRGRITLAHSTREDALPPLRKAANLGLASGRFDVGLEALARRVYVEGTWTDYPGDPLATLDLAQSLMAHNPDPVFTHTLLLNNAGVVHMARGQRSEARTFFERAAKVRATGNHEYTELATLDFNLGLVADSSGERIALMSRAADSYGRLLGPEHPRALEHRRLAAAYRLDPSAAKQALEPVCDDLAEYHPDLHGQLARCLYQLGLSAAELGDTPQAAAHLSAAAESFARAERPVHAQLARGRSAQLAGDLDRALTELAKGRSQLAAEPTRWWNLKLAAEFELGQATIALSREDYQRAKAGLERTLSAFQRVAAHSHKAQIVWHTADNQAALASALWGPPGSGRRTGPTRERAIQLMNCAETRYRSAGPGFSHRLDSIAAWRSARGLRGMESVATGSCESVAEPAQTEQ